MTPEHLLELFKRGLIPGPSESEEEFLARVSSRPHLNHLPSTPFGFTIDWIPITYSSKKLLPWEGAVFWTIDGQSHIQLRPNKPPSLEILHHESIHAAREAFHEPQFEEFIAYATSPARWKRFIGPLFQRIWEFPLFALALLTPYTLPIPAFFLLRLLYRHYHFHKIKKNLPLSVIVCMTDQEIKRGLESATSTPRLELIKALHKLGD